MNNKFKLFNDLKTSKDLKEKIIKNTIDNDKNSIIKAKYQISKLAYSILFICMLSFLSIGIVFAIRYIQTTDIRFLGEEIGHSEYRLFLENKIVVNEVYDFDCQNVDSLENLGNILGIKLYYNENYNIVIDECDVWMSENGKIEALTTTIHDYVDYEGETPGFDEDYFGNYKQLTFEMRFITENATDDIIYELSTSKPVTNEKGIEEFLIDDLGILVYTFGLRDPNEYKFWFSYVAFTYNDIVYIYRGTNITTEEIINLIF